MRNYPKAGSKELIIMTTVFNITTALIKLPLQSTVRWHKSSSEKVPDSVLKLFNTLTNFCNSRVANLKYQENFNSLIKNSAESCLWLSASCP